MANHTVTMFTARTAMTNEQLRDKLAALTNSNVIINGPGYIDATNREHVHLYTFVGTSGEKFVGIKRKVRAMFGSAVKSAY